MPIMNNLKTANPTSITLPTDKQGVHSSAGNQAEFEKSLAGTLPPQNTDLEGYQTMDIPENGPLNPTSPKKQKQKRHKWTREEYREIMKAYFKACLYPSEQNNTEQTYAIWSKNKQHDNMDANKLANLRRDIVKNNRLTSAELEEIKREIHSDRNEMTSANKTCAEIAPELYQEWFDENEHEQTFHGFEPDNSIIEDNQQENHQDRAKIDILKDDIIKEWTTLEHQTMQDRILLPKIQLNRANRKTIELANRAVKEVTNIIGIRT